MLNDVFQKIKNLKEKQKTIILAHTYANSDVQNVADFVGDSYALSKKAANCGDCDSIIFAGVRFMAETAKILSPRKAVFLPVKDAGCPMADMINEAQLREFKKEHPNAAVVCYVNSDVKIKALSDICVTSSNAVKIVNKIKRQEIIFIPDRNLGSFVAEQVPQKKIVCWNGFCPVHNFVTVEDLLKTKKLYPNALVLMHPETPAAVRKFADFVLSTGQMVELVKEKKHKRYLIVTESGILHSLAKADKDAEFIELFNKSLICGDMKKITLFDILQSLEKNIFEVQIEPEIAQRARSSLEKMLELAE